MAAAMKLPNCRPSTQNANHHLLDERIELFATIDPYKLSRTKGKRKFGLTIMSYLFSLCLYGIGHDGQQYTRLVSWRSRDDDP